MTESMGGILNQSERIESSSRSNNAFVTHFLTGAGPSTHHPWGP